MNTLREHLEAIRDGNDCIEKHDNGCTHCWTQREAIAALKLIDSPDDESSCPNEKLETSERERVVR